MDTSIYEKLRSQIDQYSIGFNATKSGIEIKILKTLFSEDEAHIYLNLARKLETADVIAARADRNEQRVAILLEQMTQKGLTFPRKRNGKNYYSAAPFMHGFFENLAQTKMDGNLAQMFEEYVNNGFVPKTFSLKSVPINITVDNRGIVLPFDDVKKIIESKERIGLMKCPCMIKALKLEHKCDNPIEVCLVFDYYAEYGIDFYGQGRWITKEEALEVLIKAEKAGLVHQVGGSAENIECICNCCPDCCMGLKIIRKLHSPAKAAKSNYMPQRVSGRCFQCGDCLRRCPMDALSLNDDGISVDLNRCIGCGLCVTACAAGAIELLSKPESEIRGFMPAEKYKFLRSSLEFDRDVE